jgi:hypothetical protein
MCKEGCDSKVRQMCAVLHVLDSPVAWISDALV